MTAHFETSALFSGKMLQHTSTDQGEAACKTRVHWLGGQNEKK
jgi:hypothetical protein